MARKNETKPGKLSIADMRNLVNKKYGQEVAHDLTKDNPTEVTDWISTGSRWLDSIICRGKLAGIPVGKITEIAGLEGTGKSYMAAQIAANAMAKGMDVVYFDSESAVDPDFLESTGCDLSKLLYIQATTTEFVLETIEELLTANNGSMFFIWDSLANTPAAADVEGSFDPMSSMAMKPRILSRAFSKLTIPIANTQSTLLILNQLKTNITSNRAELLTDPYFTPGGKAPAYAYSLRIWLTGRKAKDSFILDERGYQVGSEVKAKIKKSRFGSLNRECTFKILWAGGSSKIQDEESWFNAVKSSKHLEQSGAWYSLVYEDGSKEKFQGAHWSEKLQDAKFRDRVLQLMEEEVILKFESREGDPKAYYDVDLEEDETAS
jgi:recombination protein RecA